MTNLIFFIMNDLLTWHKLHPNSYSCLLAHQFLMCMLRSLFHIVRIYDTVSRLSTDHNDRLSRCATFSTSWALMTPLSRGVCCVTCSTPWALMTPLSRGSISRFFMRPYSIAVASSGVLQHQHFLLDIHRHITWSGPINDGGRYVPSRNANSYIPRGCWERRSNTYPKQEDIKLHFDLQVENSKRSIRKSFGTIENQKIVGKVVVFKAVRGLVFG